MLAVVNQERLGVVFGICSWRLVAALPMHTAASRTRRIALQHLKSLMPGLGWSNVVKHGLVKHGQAMHGKPAITGFAAMSFCRPNESCVCVCMTTTEALHWLVSGRYSCLPHPWMPWRCRTLEVFLLEAWWRRFKLTVTANVLLTIVSLISCVRGRVHGQHNGREYNYVLLGAFRHSYLCCTSCIDYPYLIV